MEKKRKIGGLILSAVLPAVALGPVAMASEAGVKTERSKSISAKQIPVEKGSTALGYNIDEFWFTNRRGVDLYAFVMYPKEPGEHPLVLACHAAIGMAWWYAAFCDRFAKRGYVVAYIDSQGQGLSYGVVPKEGDIYDTEALALDYKDLLDYVLADQNYGTIIDEEQIGMWGFCLGTMTGSKLITMDSRIKAASFLATAWDHPSIYTEACKDTFPEISIPVQVAGTLNDLHEGILLVPAYADLPYAYNALKGPKQLLIYDPAPLMIGMMRNERWDNYIDNVCDWLDYWVKGNASKYNELVAPNEFCNVIPMAYYLNEDDYLEITPEAQSLLEEMNEKYGREYAVTLLQYLVPILHETWPILRPIIALTGALLPYGTVWWAMLDHIEVNIPIIGDLVDLIWQGVLATILEVLVASPLWVQLFYGVAILIKTVFDTGIWQMVWSLLIDLIQLLVEIVPPF